MLRQVVLTTRRAESAAKLAELREKLADFEKRRAAMKTREEELEAAVNEITTETSEEDKTALAALCDEFEAERKSLEDECGLTSTEAEKLEKIIADLDNELGELNARTDNITKNIEIRKDEFTMKKFFGMSMEQRDAFVARDDVKSFLERVRNLSMERRSVAGGELLIPDVMLDLLRQNVGQYSKLINVVNLRRVAGSARMPIDGAVPEAIWTEMCGVLNELNIAFNAVEVDGYKVGGYIVICNAILADSDVNLAAEIIEKLGAAIGRALDKAILYGTGTKMPQGIVTRLAQESEPANYPATAPTWEDLHSTNIVTISADNSVGMKLFQNLLGAASTTANGYATGSRFWAMNEYTRMQLMAQAMVFNANGSIVADGLTQMPVIGGQIVVLPDTVIANNQIVCGFGDEYLLAERAGTAISQSEHVRFLEDQTVFKGTARYDGMPVIAKGFVAIGINGTSPATTATFGNDAANTVVTPTAMPGTSTFTTSTMVFLSTETPGAKIYYTDNGNNPTTSSTQYDGPITLTATKTIKAIAVKAGMANSDVMSATYTKS